MDPVEACNRTGEAIGFTLWKLASGAHELVHGTLH
jgi:hypothetical protein